MEKLDKKIVFVVQKSLYRNFKDICDNRYKTMSEVFRDFMFRYIEGDKNGTSQIK